MLAFFSITISVIHITEKMYWCEAYQMWQRMKNASIGLKTKETFHNNLSSVHAVWLVIIEKNFKIPNIFSKIKF